MHDLDQVDRLLALVADRVPPHRPFAEDGEEQWWALNEFGNPYCKECLTRINLLEPHKHTWVCGLCNAAFATRDTWRFHVSVCVRHRGGAGGNGTVVMK